MIKNYITCSIRSLLKNKKSFLLSIFQLIIGLLSFLMVMIYINYDLSFDKHLKDSEKIFRLTTTYRFSPSDILNSALTSPVVAPELKEKIPDIESFTRVYPTYNRVIRSNDQKFVEDNIHWVDSSFFEVFQFDFILGDPKTALNNPNSVVITEAISKKYFKDGNPLGQILKIGITDEDYYEVTGVINYPKKNSHLIFNYMLSNHSKDVFQNRNPGAFKLYSYVKLKEKKNQLSIKPKIEEIINNWGIKELSTEKFSIDLEPIRDIHLRSEKKQDYAIKGNLKELLLVAALGILVLILSCLNYINLVVLKSEDRAKEISIRKVLGASKRDIIFQFLSESNLLAIISMVVTLISLYLIWPWYKDFSEKNLFISPQFIILIVVSTIVLIGNVTGFYPSVILSRFNPAVVLKGAFRDSTKGIIYRRIFIIFQFTITIVIAICAIFINKQMHYIKNADYGYDRNKILVVALRTDEQKSNFKVVKNELENCSGIDKVTFSSAVPGALFKQKVFTAFGEEEKKILICNAIADYDYIKTLGIQIIKGRDFSLEHKTDLNEALIINESAAKILGFDDPIGKEIFDVVDNKRMRIIGVAKNFNFKSLYNDIEPLVIRLGDESFELISIKLKKTHDVIAIKKIEDILQEFEPGSPFSPVYLEDEWSRSYKRDKMISEIFKIILIIVIFIAGIGLFTFSNYLAQKWEKNICIRKTFGASRTSIVYRYIKEYMILLSVSMIIAFGISYFLVKLWLQNFAFKIEITASVFLITGFLTAILIFSTMIFGILKSLNADPSKVLRSE